MGRYAEAHAIPSFGAGAGPGGIDCAVDQIREICCCWVDERAS
jgi:hypothetical protein